MLKAASSLFLIFFITGCVDRISSKIDEIIGLSEDTRPVVAESLYCYRTIGKANCYTEPLKGQESNRLIGYDGTSPRTTSGSGPLRP